jgi:hypothetical protein
VGFGQQVVGRVGEVEGVGPPVGRVAVAFHESAFLHGVDKPHHHVAMDAHGVGQLLLGLALPAGEVHEQAEVRRLYAQGREAPGELLRAVCAELGEQEAGAAGERRARRGVGAIDHTLMLATNIVAARDNHCRGVLASVQADAHGRSSAAFGTTTGPDHAASAEERLVMILITGATGTVGRPLIDLLSGGGADVRAVTRSPRTATLPAGVEVVEGDPSRPDTLTFALREVTAVFVNPAAVGNAIGELLTLAKEHAARRVVLLSALAVDEGEPDNAIATHHRSLEDTVTECGLEWVILRPGMFAANALFNGPRKRVPRTSSAGRMRCLPMRRSTNATSPRSPRGRCAPANSWVGGSP